MRVVAVVGLLVLVLVRPALAADGSWPAIDALASKLASRPAQIHCVTQEQWEKDPNVVNGAAHNFTLLGYSVPQAATPFAVLPPQVCGPLVLLIADPNERTSIKGYAWREGRALLTFLHEVTHLSDPLNRLTEAETECRAYRSVRQVARSLGVRARRIDALYDGATSLHLSLPREYRSGC